MHSTVVIRAEKLSKYYPLGIRRGWDLRPDSLSRSAMAWLRRVGNRLRGRCSPPPAAAAPFWALRDVSFEIERGDVVGLIGRNGTGKSTLLKILARITDPTDGRAEIHGRVGSLLEVGTGFHPDLSGRENIYLSGTFLGMRKKEIDRYFDDIVSFAEVNRFLDTPVKHYSSGMFTRLAFAVAAHLRTEVLLVDEVLAVGDIDFQKKCLGKMEDAAGEGRTVLFVSHDVQAVSRLCKRVLLLEEGRVVADGDAAAVIPRYAKTAGAPPCARQWPPSYNPLGSDACRLLSARVVDRYGKSRDTFDAGEEIAVEVEFDRLRSDVALMPNLHFYTGERVLAFITRQPYEPHLVGPGLPPGRYSVRCTVPPRLLNEGAYSLLVAISSLGPVVVHCLERDAVGFAVVDNEQPSAFRRKYGGPVPGAVQPQLPWSMTRG